MVQFEFQYTPKVPLVPIAETLEMGILGRRDQTVKVDRSRARKMANCNHLFCNNPPSLSLSNTIGMAINLRIGIGVVVFSGCERASFCKVWQSGLCWSV